MNLIRHKSIPATKAIVYALFVLLYFIVCVYKVYTIEWITDNLNYKNIYEDILMNPFPFEVEFILSSLMWLSSYLNVDYQIFLLLKQFLWSIVFIWLDYKIFYKNNDTMFSLLFLFCCLHPGFIGSMIFLGRQSLSIMFVFCAFLSTGKKFKLLYYALAIFSHLSAVSVIVLLIPKIRELFISKKIKVSILVLALIVVFFKVDFASFFIFSLANYLPIPDFLAYNLNAKIGYHLQGTSAIDNSVIAEIAFFMIIVFDLCVFSKCAAALENENIILSNVSALFYSSLLAYFFLYANPMLSNRIGFVSYFMIAPYIGYFTCVHYRSSIKRNLFSVFFKKNGRYYDSRLI